VPAGQVLRVCGANGAGTSSLLRILCGLLEPTQGAVWWRGRPVRGLREELGPDLVYLGHAIGLKDDLSPTENLCAAARLQGRPLQGPDARQALESAGLGDCRHVPVRRLSQGQRRRAALARLALAGPSPLWILDEPFSALDADAVDWLRSVLQAHVRRAGTVVLTCHQGVPLDDAAQQVIAL
jgi:heme exporter protein A